MDRPGVSGNRPWRRPGAGAGAGRRAPAAGWRAGVLALLAASLGAGVQAPPPALAQTALPSVPVARSDTDLPSVATLAPLVLGAPVVAVATVRSTRKPGRRDPQPPEGQARLSISADVQRVIQSRDPVPARIQYVWTGPLDPDGKPPGLRKQTVLVFAEPEGAFDGPYRLVGSQPQWLWSQALEDRVRDLVGQAQRPAVRNLRLGTIRAAVDVDADPNFRRTLGFVIDQVQGSPVTLLVRDRSALAGDVAIGWPDAGQSVEPVVRNTLLWAQLACALPRTLPAEVVADYAGSVQDSVTIPADPLPVIDPEAAAAMRAARKAAEAAAQARSAAAKIEVERAYARLLARLGPCQ